VVSQETPSYNAFTIGFLYYLSHIFDMQIIPIFKSSKIVFFELVTYCLNTVLFFTCLMFWHDIFQQQLKVNYEEFHNFF